MLGSLDNACQVVVWVREHSSFSPSGGNQKVICRFDVYPGTDAGLESSKADVPKPAKTRIGQFPHTSNCSIFVI